MDEKNHRPYQDGAKHIAERLKSIHDREGGHDVWECMGNPINLASY
jgi:hypothetical protein